MALITGTPLGITTSQDIFINTPPVFYFQEKFVNNTSTQVGLLNDPDGDNFFWNLSGTAANPVFEGGCYDTFAFTDVREINMVRCDTEGDRQAIQRRTSMQVTFNLKEFFKLTKLRHMLNLGPVTTTAGATEKLGIGSIDNTKFFNLYFPTVYDENTGDFLSVTLHKAQFTGAWSMTFPFAAAGTVAIEATAFSDTTKPTAQQFGTIIRADPSAI